MGGWLPDILKPIIAGVVVLAIAEAVKYIYNKIRSQSGTKPLILDHEGHRTSPVFWLSKRRRLAALSIFCVGFLGCLIWMHHQHTQPNLLPPLPPALLIGSTTSPMPMKKGNVVRIEKSAWPWSYGQTTGRGLDGLPTLPGGPNFRKPYMVLLPTKFVIQSRNDEPIYYLFFETEITNGGESSVAKDWGLCLVDSHGKAVEFEAESFDPAGHIELGQKAVSLMAVTNEAPVEHAHSAKGWLLFKVPKDFLALPSFNGSIYCRDYMERRVFFTFATS